MIRVCGEEDYVWFGEKAIDVEVVVEKSNLVGGTDDTVGKQSRWKWSGEWEEALKNGELWTTTLPKMFVLLGG